VLNASDIGRFFLGGSGGSGVLAVRDKWNKTYFGIAVRPRDRVIDRSVANPGADKLITSLIDWERWTH